MSEAQDSGKLKAVLLETLIDRIENGETVLNKEGAAVSVSAPAATLNAAISFLKQFPPEDADKVIKSDELSDKLRGYTGKMPFPTGVRPN